jgi:outer membrane protein OmpA-like peptidoglycan-associated protein
LAGDAGLGYLQPFHLFGRTLSARAELRYRYDYQEPPRPTNAPSTFSDLVFNLGVQIPLSGEEEPAVKPAVTVVPATTGDSDQDGVPDDRDQCANTPPGSYVNNVGCPREPEAVVAPATTTEADEGPVTLENAKAGDTIVLTGVTFEFNSSRLTSNAQVILDPVARQLIQRPELRIEVGGHTDGKGSAAYNQKLSERRAASVKSYLEQHGVDASRLSSKGYGMTQPVDTNETDEGREHNRRVEMKVLE